jgi:hypothetical protein
MHLLKLKYYFGQTSIDDEARDFTNFIMLIIAYKAVGDRLITFGIDL